MSTPCNRDSGSYQGSSHTVGYLTFTSGCVCVERVPFATQTFVATSGVLTLLVTFTSACVGVERVTIVTDSVSYQGSSHTVGYLTFTSGCVCGKSTSCYTDSGSYQGSSHTVGYLTFTSICVCVERVPLVTQTAVATKGVLTLLFTRAVVTFVHV